MPESSQRAVSASSASVPTGAALTGAALTGAARTPYLMADLPENNLPVLFCFPHAGGAASAFRPLADLLAGRVNIVPVQLPGRERRRQDPLPADMAALVEDIDRHLDPHLDIPHAFYGHSMGGLIAYDLAERRHARGARTPLRLLVGACRAPHLPPAFASARLLSDRELQDRMIATGGMSQQLLSYPDWVASALEQTRGDLHLVASRRHQLLAPAAYPIDAFAGLGDSLVSTSDVMAWHQHAGAGFDLHGLDGGHFFQLGEHAAAFAAKVEAVLAQDTALQDTALKGGTPS